MLTSQGSSVNPSRRFLLGVLCALALILFVIPGLPGAGSRTEAVVIYVGLPMITIVTVAGAVALGLRARRQGLAAVPGIVAPLGAAGVVVLFFAGWIIGDSFVDAAPAQAALGLLPFGLPLLVGVALVLRRRTRSIGRGILGGLALGVALALVLAFTLMSVLFSNIGS